MRSTLPPPPVGQATSLHTALLYSDHHHHRHRCTIVTDPGACLKLLPQDAICCLDTAWLKHGLEHGRHGTTSTRGLLYHRPD